METTEAVYKNAGVAYIETQSGRFYPENPEFVIGDIAHALSLNCRFNGHCSAFYSVAEHSVMVSHLMEQLGLGDPMEGLLHDATEAYLTDVPAPFKQFLPDLQRFDEALEDKLRRHFLLPLKKTVGCKRADWLALFIEADVLIPSRAVEWLDPQGLRPLALGLGIVPQCWPPSYAEEQFLNRYHSLSVP